MLQDHEAWAVFGQVDVQLLEQWSVSAGLRYTDEKKRLDGTFTQGNTGPPPDFAAIGTNLFLANQGLASLDPSLLAPLLYPGWGFYLQPVFAPRPDVDETLKDDRVTWNVKLSWTPNDDLLLYAGYATGFKSGGTNTDRIPAAFSQVFGAEKSDSFEAGMKLVIPEHSLRVNLTSRTARLRPSRCGSGSRRETPVVAAHVHWIGQRRRHLNEGPEIRAASLQHQHRIAAAL